jgi:hypothetical protein
LAPNGVTLYERRQAQDVPDEPVLERSYERVPDPIRCTAVGQLDFKNLTVDLDGELVPFRNGAADTYPLGAATTFEDGVQPQAEFRYEIVFDKTVSPAPSIAVRMLGITQEHLTGSGWLNHIAGFTCAAGVLHKEFDRRALSLILETLTDNEITVSMLPYYGKNTAKWWRYKWSREARRYQLESVWLTPKRLCRPTTVMAGQCYESAR